MKITHYQKGSLHHDLNHIFRIMKITLLLLILGISPVISMTYSQKTLFSLDITSNSIREVISLIEQKSEYVFFFSEDIHTELNRKVDVQVDSKTLDVILDEIFSNTNLTYKIKDRQVSIARSENKTSKENTSQQQARTISGTVFDEMNEPLIGVNILVKETSTGTITDMTGNFSLSVNSADVTIVVSYIGYITQEIRVGNQQVLNIVLKPDQLGLDEVVVIGYGVQKKINMTGSVATVSQKDITKSTSINLTNALAGRLPGLTAYNGSGSPGSGSQLLIRGMGTWNDTNPLIIVDGVEREFSYLDPNEVEAISVLKDAAASSVYGARAANGVILVTTKRGKEGRPTVSFNSHYGMSSPTRYPELASPYQWASTRNLAYQLDGVDASDPRIYTDDQLASFRSGEEGTNWYDETFKSHASNYYVNVNLSGGTNAVKYFVLLGHNKEDGLVENYDFAKYNIRSNIDAQVTKRFKVGVDLDFNNRVLNSSGYDAATIFSLVPRTPPIYKAYYPNGLPVNTKGEHLVEMVRNSGNHKNEYNEFRTTLKADLEIPGVKGLVAKGFLSYGKNYTYQKQFSVPYEMYDVNEKGEITNTKVVGGKTNLKESFTQGSGYTYNVSLNYNNTFNKHEVGALFLYEEEVSKGNNFSASRTNYISNSIPELFAGGDTEKDNTGSANEWARNGLVGRLNYAYDLKYLFELSFRYDGSITFPKGKRYGFFPSGSVAWRLSEESFIKDNFTFIDNLKIRASYGVLGNDRVALWQYLSSFTYSPVATIGDENIKTISVYNNLYPNPDITWEKSATTNIGLEGSFWNGLLGFELDWFKKRTTDILAPRIRTIPGTFGASLPDENYGILENKGFEVMLRHERAIGKDIRYSIGFNLSYAKNKVIEFDESDTTPEYYRVVGKSFTHVSDRQPQAGFVGMESLGMFQTYEDIENWYPQFNGGQKPGDVKYNDVNGDQKVDEYDLKVITKYGTIPEITYGFNLGFSYKTIEFSALFQGAAHKSVLLSFFGRVMYADGASNYFNYLAEDAWTPDNRDAIYPRPFVGANTNNNRDSDMWVKNGNYLRLKNIELAYTLPTKVMNATKLVNNIRIYVNATNILTFDKLKIMDPETSSGSAQYYPQQKTVTFGIGITY